MDREKEKIEMNKTAVHIITGNGDTGKTTCAWFIYLFLKAKGTVEYFRSFPNGNYEILPESEKPADKIDSYEQDGVKRAHDFCAIVVVAGIRIAIFSAGDNITAVQTAFNWLARIDVHAFIGCCHSSWNSNARKELYKYESVYTIRLYRVYWNPELVTWEKIHINRIQLITGIIENILIPNTEERENIKRNIRLDYIEHCFDDLIAYMNSIKEQNPDELPAINDIESLRFDLQEQRVMCQLKKLNTLMKKLRPHLKYYMV